MRRTANICTRWALLGLTATLLLTPLARGQMTEIPSDKGKPQLDGTVTLTIYEWGIQPANLSIKAGRWALVIQNRSLSQHFTVNVTKGDQGSVTLSSRHDRYSRDQGYLRIIQPGTYRVSVSERPFWTCTLKVVPK